MWCDFGANLVQHFIGDTKTPRDNYSCAIGYGADRRKRSILTFNYGINYGRVGFHRLFYFRAVLTYFALYYIIEAIKSIQGVKI